MSPAGTLNHLEDIVKAIVSGKLTVTSKRASSAQKYRLVLQDGETLDGSMGWLLPVMPWTQTKTNRYVPYGGNS